MKRLIKKMLSSVGYQVHRLHASQVGLISIHKVAHGSKSFLFASDRPCDGVQKYHASGEFYEAGELAMIRSLFRPGVFVDVGANVGNHSIYMANVPGCERVVAVEPNPRALRLLRLNLSLNDVENRVDVVPAAFSDSEAEFSMRTPSNNLGGTTIMKNARGNQPAEEVGVCQSLLGSNVLRGVGVSFIKIDVEAHEMEVLRGLREVIERARPDVFIEVSRDDRSNIEAFFAELGYSIAEPVPPDNPLVTIMFLSEVGRPQRDGDVGR
jgi:FkbM family methyltransferase